MTDGRTDIHTHTQTYLYSATRRTKNSKFFFKFFFGHRGGSASFFWSPRGRMQPREWHDSCTFDWFFSCIFVWQNTQTHKTHKQTHKQTYPFTNLPFASKNKKIIKWKSALDQNCFFCFCVWWCHSCPETKKINIFWSRADFDLIIFFVFFILFWVLSENQLRCGGNFWVKLPFKPIIRALSFMLGPSKWSCWIPNSILKISPQNGQGFP